MVTRSIKLPPVIDHRNMGQLLDALTKEPYFQPGNGARSDRGAWFRKEVIVEFPTGELARGWLANLALVGNRAVVYAGITGKEGFNAQGLEGKVQVRKDLFGALMNLRDLLPEYRGRILVNGAR